MPGLDSEPPRQETFFDALDALTQPKCNEKEEATQRNSRLQRQLSINGFFSEHISINGGQVGGDQISVYGGQFWGKRKERRGIRKLFKGSEAGKNQSVVGRDESNAVSWGKESDGNEETELVEKQESTGLSSKLRARERSVRLRRFGIAEGSTNERLAVQMPEEQTQLSGVVNGDDAGFLELAKPLANERMASSKSGFEEGVSQNFGIVTGSSENVARQSAFELSRTNSSVGENDLVVEAAGSEVEGAGVSLHQPALQPESERIVSDPIGSAVAVPVLETVSRRLDPGDIDILQQGSGGGGLEARNRWRRVRHTLAFAHHMSQNLRSNSGDFLEHGEQERTTQDNNERGDAGRAGAAAFEGARLRGRFRAKGRRGMEGMLVRQEKGLITHVQDFYVACLKMPIAHFLVGVFLAPIALGLLFTPIYLLDKGGLSFDGVTLGEEGVMVGRVAAAKQKVSALVNVFLYALSLSTTFGGSPVAALSPFCLCVANVNTLMGQFLFVFLSGAVFARMSQPSHPVRCSKKAIIRSDDFNSMPSADPKEKLKVFAVRLVLSGPPPCELVDAKICLTFRIFIKLPSGSMFCSTQDLDLVRPEVSYLRYGIMVRHIIDNKSPVYGHTMESLLDGDASFSLTIMGLERTSMQPIFHLEDYFVCDGDVAWDADYIDFIHINNEGHRVLDHSKIDLIKVTKETKMGGNWKDESVVASEWKKSPDEFVASAGQASSRVVKGWTASGVGKLKGVNSKSTSFTRADW